MEVEKMGRWETMEFGFRNAECGRKGQMTEDGGRRCAVGGRRCAVGGALRLRLEAKDRGKVKRWKVGGLRPLEGEPSAVGGWRQEMEVEKMGRWEDGPAAVGGALRLRLEAGAARLEVRGWRQKS
jgi:hypothetical protein